MTYLNPAVNPSDGWTTVSRPKGGRKRKVKMPERLPPKDNVVLTSENIKNITDRIEKTLARFSESGCARDLKKLFPESKYSAEGTSLCAGLGSFAAMGGIYENRRLYQCAVFLWVSRHLAVPGKGRSLYAIDPAFTEGDIAVLKHFDINASKTSVETDLSGVGFFFAPFVDWHILTQEYIAKTKAPVLLCTNLADVIDRAELLTKSTPAQNNGADPWNQHHARLSNPVLDNIIGISKNVLATYNDASFPDGDDSAHALKGLKVYTRMTEDRLDQ